YDEDLERVLPRDIHTIEKHDSLPAKEFPTFMQRLRDFRYGGTFAKKMGLPKEQRPSIALLIEFTILNGCRIGWARKALWKEFDFGERVWHVPKSHLKNGRLYTGDGLDRPLTQEMLDILEELGRRSNQEPDAPVFRPTGSPGKVPTGLFNDTSPNT